MTSQVAADRTTASLGRVFADRVEATPEAEAFRFRSGADWKSLNWTETRTRAFELAAGLIELGVQPEQRVAIAATTRIEWVLADLAILCAGAATTTVYPSTNADEVQFIVGNSESVVVFAEDAGQLAKLAGIELPALTAVVLMDLAGVDLTRTGDRRVLGFDELAELGRRRLTAQPDLITDRIAEIQPEQLATLIYTSGTTGRPKGVRLVHADWTYEGRAVTQLNIIDPTDLQYLWLPLSHVLGKMLMTIQLELGFATAIDGDLSRIVENLAAVKPTFMCGAPRIFEKVRAKVTATAQGHGGPKAKIFDWAFATGIKASRLRQRRQALPPLLRLQLAVADTLVLHKIRDLVGGRIKFLISGSAQLSTDVAEWFDAARLTILEGYGLTESSAACSVNLPGDTRIGTVGPALPGSEFKIAADGEILLRGGGVMRGYHGLDGATREVLTEDGWLHTGDIGTLDADGYLSVTDRKKDLIKTSGGKYVAPQKLETAFKALCPYVSQFMVYGEGRHFITALVTLDPEPLADWVQEHDLAGRSPAELAESDAVHTLVQGYIDQLNAGLERWETVKKFAVLPRDLSIEDGELTPSMKVRRKVVTGQHMDRLDALYRD